MAVETPGDFAKPPGQVVHLDDRQPHPGALPGRDALFYHRCDRTGRLGTGQIVAAIVPLARQCEEEVPRPHTTAVQGEPGHRYRHRIGNTGEQPEQRHRMAGIGGGSHHAPPPAFDSVAAISS